MENKTETRPILRATGILSSLARNAGAVYRDGFSVQG